MREDFLSTEHMGWLLGVSPEAVRRMIREGELEGVRLPAGFRVKRHEALRASRARIEAETGRNVSDRELERLVDRVIEENQTRTGATA